jgi:Flp pilus assembly protein TadG
MEQARVSGNLLPTESGQGLVEFVLIAAFLFLAYLAIRGLIVTGVF